MKKIVLKLGIILLILQLVIGISSINMAFASESDPSQDWDVKAQAFEEMGNNKISVLGIDAETMTEPLIIVMRLVQFVGVAVGCGRMLLTSIRLLSQDTIDKAVAKKEIGISLLILGLAVAGPALVVELVEIFT